MLVFFYLFSFVCKRVCKYEHTAIKTASKMWQSACVTCSYVPQRVSKCIGLHLYYHTYDCTAMAYASLRCMQHVHNWQLHNEK